MFMTYHSRVMNSLMVSPLLVAHVESRVDIYTRNIYVRVVYVQKSMRIEVPEGSRIHNTKSSRACKARALTLTQALALVTEPSTRYPGS